MRVLWRSGCVGGRGRRCRFPFDGGALNNIVYAQGSSLVDAHMSKRAGRYEGDIHDASPLDSARPLPDHPR